ncbi:MAG: ATP-binding protein [Ginsengibacter sp.]
MKTEFKPGSHRFIFLVYWFLLAYIIAALVFWFVELNSQNLEISRYKRDLIDVNDPLHFRKTLDLESAFHRNELQFIGEGATFFFLIIAGAAFVFRIIDKQLQQSRQQQNFMMAITHELKTPIAVTQLNLETMQRRKLSSDQQKQLINATLEEASRLDNLCNNMLLLGQLDAGAYQLSFERINLSQLASDCTSGFINRFPDRTIDMDIEDEYFISGDKLLLQIAINNLVDNAIKYSAKTDIISLRLFADDKWLKLQVKDEGEGISQTDKKKIFQKYYRASHRQTKGTGLGLYITKQIVKQHHGDILVTNNNSRGSIFEMDFKILNNAS